MYVFGTCIARTSSCVTFKVECFLLSIFQRVLTREVSSIYHGIQAFVLHCQLMYDCVGLVAVSHAADSRRCGLTVVIDCGCKTCTKMRLSQNTDSASLHKPLLRVQ